MRYSKKLFINHNKKPIARTVSINFLPKVSVSSLMSAPITKITPKIAKKAGELRRDYSRPFADMLIAATAIELSGLWKYNLR